MTDLNHSILQRSPASIADYFQAKVYDVEDAIKNGATTYQDVYVFLRNKKEKKTNDMFNRLSSRFIDGRFQ